MSGVIKREKEPSNVIARLSHTVAYLVFGLERCEHA